MKKGFKFFKKRNATDKITDEQMASMLNINVDEVRHAFSHMSESDKEHSRTKYQGIRDTASSRHFGMSLFGYKKSHVNSYIDTIIDELGHIDEMLRRKDEEILLLRKQYNNAAEERVQPLEVPVESGDIRLKIANVLIEAQKEAERIIEEGRQKALLEKESIQKEIEAERQALEVLKNESRGLKIRLASTMRELEQSLKSYSGDDGEKF